MVRNEPPAEVKERSLPASLDYAEIRIHAAAKLFGSHEDDPGLVRISGTVIVPDLHDEDEEPISSIEGIGLEVVDGATAEITILRAEAVVLDLGRIKYLFETLDADSEELLRYSCLFDFKGGEGLHPDLEETLEGFGEHVVIAKRVRLAPAWRGFGGVGRYLFGRMLPLMCCDPVVVAAQPFPLDVDRDERGNAEKAALKRGLAQTRRIWKSIGFEPYKDDIWIMDPNLVKHDRALTRLERKLRLSDMS
jgi:hypothetical protein